MNEDRIASRVAREIVSVRPIRLNKSWLKGDTKDIVRDIGKKLKRYPEDEPIGKFLSNHHVTIKDVSGDKVSVVVVVRSRPGAPAKDTWVSAKGTVLGGGAGKIPSSGLPAIVVEINASYFPRLFRTNMFERELFKLILHELTHIADKFKKKPEETRRRVPNEEELDLKEYYNTPAEVRAYMQEIVEEVQGYFTPLYEAHGMKKAECGME